MSSVKEILAILNLSGVIMNILLKITFLYADLRLKIAFYRRVQIHNFKRTIKSSDIPEDLAKSLMEKYIEVLNSILSIGVPNNFLKGFTGDFFMFRGYKLIHRTLGENKWKKA